MVRPFAQEPRIHDDRRRCRMRGRTADAPGGRSTRMRSRVHRDRRRPRMGRRTADRLRRRSPCMRPRIRAQRRRSGVRSGPTGWGRGRSPLSAGRGLRPIRARLHQLRGHCSWLSERRREGRVRRHLAHRRPARERIVPQHGPLARSLRRLLLCRAGLACGHQALPSRIVAIAAPNGTRGSNPSCLRARSPFATQL